MTSRSALLAAALTLSLVSLALACRYTVRDIGFVQLTAPEVQLVLLESDKEQAIELALRDVPVTVVSVDPDRSPDHPGVRAAQAANATAILVDPTGRTCHTTDPLSIGHGPFAKKLAEDASSTFAHVVLLESSNAQANTAARAECERLQSSLKAIEVHLPRPLGHPLRIEQLGAPQQVRERELFWSLGIDVPVQEPTVLVLYGRARRAGEPVILTEETRIEGTRELLAQLALVGESCECETSRAWTAEPVGLIQWTRPIHAEASESLGFDPASPIVRNEVIRILGKGPNPKAGDRPEPDSLEELLLGYGETPLTPIEPQRSTPAESESRQRPPPPQVIRASEGDDWSFDEPVQNERDRIAPINQTVVEGAPTPSPFLSNASRAILLMASVIVVGAICTVVLLRKSGGSP